MLTKAKEFHYHLKDYDPNVFPVKNLNHLQSPVAIDELEMEYRQKVINLIRELPKVFIRNHKDLIRRPIDDIDVDVMSQLNTIAVAIKRLPTKEPLHTQLVNKILSSTNTLFKASEVADTLALNYNTKTAGVTRESILSGLKDINAKIIRHTPEFLIIRANDKTAIEKLGCLTLWCFSIYKGKEGNEYWTGKAGYAKSGYAYVIYDFTKDTEDANFLLVYLPESETLFNASNSKVEVSRLGELGINSSELL